MTVEEGMRIGKYELKKELGKGGFGQVFRARDTALGRDCALKFLLPEHTTKQDLLQRFLQEARSAAQITHGGIVTVFECGIFEDGDAEGMAYIAMELLQGESLGMRLERGPLPPDLAIEIARQVASALGAAHAAGIVHRDLKPDNVWLVPDVASAIGLRVKVLDFGIAKLAEGNNPTGVQTSTIQIFGTPHYMSPEQCRSTAGVDGRTDIYALGVMLFEMLVGGRPFEGVPAVLIAAHQLLAPPSLRVVKPEVAHLDDIVQTMLAKEVTDRPASMDDVMARLEPMRRTSGSISAVQASGSSPAMSPPPPSSPPRTPSGPDGAATRDLRAVSNAPSPSPSATVPSNTPSAPLTGASNTPSAPPTVGEVPSALAAGPQAPRVTAGESPPPVPTTQVVARPRSRAALWIALGVVVVVGAVVAFVVVKASKKDAGKDAPAAAVNPPTEPARDAAPAAAPDATPTVVSGSGSAPAPGKRGKPDPSKVYAVPVGVAPYTGLLGAPVTLIVGTDYACGPCADANEVVKQLRAKYAREDLRIVYKSNLVHAASKPSAYGACAAAKQNKLLPFDRELWSWELGKALKDGDKLADNFDVAGCWETRKGCQYMNEAAGQLGLDTEKFVADLKTCSADVEAWVANWRHFGITTAPAFFVNGRVLLGAHKQAVFERLIDAELALAKERIAAGSPAASYYRDWVLGKGEP